MIRVLDLFSGIGGFSYAAENLVGGFKTTQFVEVDKSCQRVLKKHWPTTPIHDDIRSFTATHGSFDLITAGFPCQDISSAGKKLGFSGERSSLFYEIIRLVGEVRPKFILLENVRNIVSLAKGETFQEVLFQIAKSGYDAEWACIPASAVGACHQRARWWLVAYPKRQRSDEGATGEGLRRKRQEEMPQLGATWFNGSRELSRPVAGGESVTLSPDWRSYLSQPVLCRGDDGLSGRVDRLKQLGNSIVPQVAAIPLTRIKELYTQHVH